LFTLKDFFQSYHFKWIKSYLPYETDFDLPICYVSVNEMPVESFIRENELVISTAVGCEKNEDLMFQLIKDIHKSKATALLLSNINDSLILPKKVMEYIIGNQFPVFLIPWEYRFADIIEFVIDKINNYKSKESTKYEAVEKLLLDAYLKNSELSDAVLILEKKFNCSITLYDINLKPKNNRRDVPANQKEFNSHSIEIRNESRLYGYLFSTTDVLLDKSKFSLIQRYIIQPLILWFSKEEIIRTSKQIEKDDFIWSIAKGTSEDMDKTQKKASLLGFDLSVPYICIVGKLHTTNALKNENDWINFNISSIKEEILNLGYSHKKKIFLTYQQELLIIYLENINDTSHSYINVFLDDIEKKISATFPFLSFSWGVSEILKDKANFTQYYMHAKLAQELCKKKDNKNCRFFYENTIIFSILSRLSSDKDISMAAYNIISPVIKYDEKKNAALMKTLLIYVKVKNVSKTSRLLHLHRQSLLYQLNKIEELTYLSFKNNNDVFLLEICMRLFFDFYD